MFLLYPFRGRTEALTDLVSCPWQPMRPGRDRAQTGLFTSLPTRKEKEVSQNFSFFTGDTQRCITFLSGLTDCQFSKPNYYFFFFLSDREKLLAASLCITSMMQNLDRRLSLKAIKIRNVSQIAEFPKIYLMQRIRTKQDFLTLFIVNKFCLILG